MTGPILDPQEAFRHAMEAQLARRISGQSTARSVEPRARPLPTVPVQNHARGAVRSHCTDGDWWAAYRGQLRSSMLAMSLAQDDENRRSGDSQDATDSCEGIQGRAAQAADGREQSKRLAETYGRNSGETGMS